MWLWAPTRSIRVKSLTSALSLTSGAAMAAPNLTANAGSCGLWERAGGGLTPRLWFDQLDVFRGAHQAACNVVCGTSAVPGGMAGRARGAGAVQLAVCSLSRLAKGWQRPLTGGSPHRVGRPGHRHVGAALWAGCEGPADMVRRADGRDGLRGGRSHASRLGTHLPAAIRGACLCRLPPQHCPPAMCAACGPSAPRQPRPRGRALEA